MSTTQKKIPTYEEYLNGQLDTAKSNAAKARTNAINNAQVQYDQSRVTYGNQAAALSNMGLTGSGYSQYLEGQALAQKNAAINNAYRTEADANAVAQDAYDTKYMTYLQQKEQDRANAFNTALENVGSLSYQDAQFLGKQYGFTAEQNKFLADKILERGGYTKDDLDAAKGVIGDDAYTAYMNTLTNIRFDPETAFLDEEGNKISATEARELISKLANTGYSKEALDELETAWHKNYGVKWDADNGFLFFGSTEVGKDGNNFSVKDADGKVYRVQYSGEEVLPDSDVYKHAPINTNNAVFVYNGKAYIVKDRKVYGIEARDNSFGDGHANGYAALLKKLGAGV